MRNALAKRRSKVAQEEDEEERRDENTARSMGGLSLKDAVRENVPRGSELKQHSPPGIAAKKDSG